MAAVIYRRLPAYSGVLVIAMLVNVLLFVFIYYLVTPSSVTLPGYTPLQVVDFIRIKPPPKKPDIPKPKKPPEPETKKPPPPKKVVAQPKAKPKPKVRAPKVSVPTARASIGPPVADPTPAPAPKPAPRAAPVPPPAPKPLAFDSNAVPTHRVEPRYPPRARRQGKSGSVTVEFIIDARGRVKSPVVVAANPPKIFNRAVLKAIRRWKFKPRFEGGQAVSRRARQTIRFALKGR